MADAVFSAPHGARPPRWRALALGRDSGSLELPVVFLEMQMRADPGFITAIGHWRVQTAWHWLAANAGD